MVVVVLFLFFSTLPMCKINFLEPEDGLIRARLPVFNNEPEPEPELEPEPEPEPRGISGQPRSHWHGIPRIA